MCTFASWAPKKSPNFLLKDNSGPKISSNKDFRSKAGNWIWKLSLKSAVPVPEFVNAVYGVDP